MTTLNVPVIDLSPFYGGDQQARNELAGEIDSVLQDIGFLVVTGHPIDPALIAKVHDVSCTFFALPEAEKMKSERPDDFYVRGYSPMLSEGLGYGIGNETPPDLKEALTIGPPGMPEAKYLLGDAYYRSETTGTHFMPNIWPAEPRELRPLWEEYFRVMAAFGVDLHHLFSIALGLPEDYFDDSIDKPFSMFRVLHYPSISAEPEPGQIRAGEHSDYDNLTICVVEPGLQARNRNGEWVDVPVVAGALVVNLGDLMMRWTNDRWVSTRHRVINPPIATDGNRSRISLIYFYECNYDAVIECLPTCQGDERPAKYPAIGAAAYITEKYTRQTRLEEWSAEHAEAYGTADAESRFKDP
jgi:isopenicillin N synthase-like dioxygenase